MLCKAICRRMGFRAWKGTFLMTMRWQNARWDDGVSGGNGSRLCASSGLLVIERDSGIQKRDSFSGV